ncbi:MAG TPA: DMT family transporter [Acidimicrobiia bacterium]|nr:DMT family transporter [Acidimicrobiia bacterium]
MLTNLHRRRYAFALTGAAASWGIATVIAKSALTEIPPVVLLPVQLAASVLLITPVLLARHRQEPQIRKLGRLIGLGILNPGISYALGLIGLLYISASEAVLLWATEPIMIMALAAVMLREHVSKTQVVAAGAATIGVVLIVTAPDGTSHLIGIALTLAAVAACAVYTILSRRWMVDESSLRVVAVQQIAALAFAVAILGAVTSTGTLTLGTVSPRSWGSAVLSGCLYYGIAFWLYLTGLKRIPASVAGQYLNLIPIFGIATSSALLGERLTGAQWVGATVIVLAVIVAARSITARVQQDSDQSAATTL